MEAVLPLVDRPSRGKTLSRVSNPKAMPPTQMRELLTRARRADLPFDRAWEVAWKQVRWPHDTGHRRDWKERLVRDRDEWRRAYERAGDDRPALRALYALFIHVGETEDRPLVA